MMPTSGTQTNLQSEIHKSEKFKLTNQHDLFWQAMELVRIFYVQYWYIIRSAYLRPNYIVSLGRISSLMKTVFFAFGYIIIIQSLQCKQVATNRCIGCSPIRSNVFQL